MSDEYLRVFVYGTLKRGQRNHARYCSKAVAIESARVVGRLFFLPAGYPMLQVPPESIQTTGTRDFAADFAAQSRTCMPAGEIELPTGDDWELIEGEVISFASNSPALERLDFLEDYRPDDPASTYLRALVPLLGAGGRAWTYVAPHGRVPADSRRIGKSWP